MPKSFKQFRTDRDIVQFGRNFDSLCENIAQTGINFDEFWLNQGLPTALNATCERDLFEGWNPASWDWKGLGQGLKQLGQADVGKFFNNPNYQAPDPNKYQMHIQQPQAAQGQPAAQPQAAPASATTPPAAPAAPAAPAQAAQAGPTTPANAQPQLSDNARAKADEAMKNIKTAFAKSMQGVIDQYKKNRDSVGYQLATAFMNKVNASADKMRVIRGTGRFDADQHFGPMSGDQLAQKASGSRTIAPQMPGMQPNVQTAMGNAPAGYANQQFATGQTGALPNGRSPSIEKRVGQPKPSDAGYWGSITT